MVTVNVSWTYSETLNQKQTFLVHKDFLCYYSPYFDAALNGRFAEGETQTIDLEDVHPKVFALFVQWLHAQKALDNKAAEICPGSLILSNLWILADRLLIPTLQNEVIVAYEKALVAYKKRPTETTLDYIYKNTTPGSLLRQYITRVVATRKVGNIERYPKDLLVDMISFMDMKGREPGLGSSAKECSADELKQFFAKEGEVEE